MISSCKIPPLKHFSVVYAKLWSESVRRMALLDARISKLIDLSLSILNETKYVDIESLDTDFETFKIYRTYAFRLIFLFQFRFLKY